jgi:hypothetical protein
MDVQTVQFHRTAALHRFRHDHDRTGRGIDPDRDNRVAGVLFVQGETQFITSPEHHSYMPLT